MHRHLGGQQQPPVHSPAGRHPEKAPVVDGGDDQADFVQVGVQHQMDAGLRRGDSGSDRAQEVAKPVQSRFAVGDEQLHGGLGGRVLQAGDARPLGETL